VIRMNIEIDPNDDNLTLTRKQSAALRQEARATRDPDTVEQLAVAYRNYQALRAPQHRAAATRHRWQLGNRIAGRMQRRSALIVTSRAHLAERLSSLVEDLGLRAAVSPDGLHGLMRTVRHKPDLVIFDADGAPVDVPAIFRRYERLASVPVIALVAEGDSRAREHYRRLGVDTITRHEVELAAGRGGPEGAN